ncbi:type II secretion system protein [Moorella sulfitireducens]|uniref:type II secretion system protein n=1 Tax=Neomoorella sulfitireducens TaxID=2972948 RepID=UPI0021ACF231|nr:type II secretion system protein [Moorella sulfitireducens]
MKRRMKRAWNEGGFTLVELLVVIAIIGILAVFIVPTALNATEKSRVAKAEADYRAIKSAALIAYADTAVWPPTKDDGTDPGFVAKVNYDGYDENSNDSDMKKWKNRWDGPYLDAWPGQNPWGGKYYYINDTEDINGDGNVDEDDLGRYLKLDKVPDGAIEKLLVNLEGENLASINLTDNSVVFPIKDSSNNYTGDIYLLISKD